MRFRLTAVLLLPSVGYRLGKPSIFSSPSLYSGVCRRWESAAANHLRLTRSQCFVSTRGSFHHLMVPNMLIDYCFYISPIVCPCPSLSRAECFSSSSGVLVRNCKACIPPALSISSLSNAYTIRCRAGCILDLKASDVITTLE